MIGDAFHFIRNLYRVPQKQLSLELDLPQANLSLIEHGRRMPNRKLVERFAKRFNIPVWFLELVGSKDKSQMDSFVIQLLDNYIKRLDKAEK